ncbi:hypothetical protein GE061_012916 [Apolygus lucorum]|uniref:Uncharacterized protein n=1 Tax=Apolygus lucorum TaxID=248454 RepID=A0A8S9XUV2_APOLU|nr:hypothetical protein GE061_012916 [Apolygus lucorum]
MCASASAYNPHSLRRVVKNSYTVLLVGNSRVGKSTLMHRFVGKYSDYVDHGSRGIEHKKIIIGNDNLVRIVVHDSDPNHRNMIESYYKFAVGIFFIYAIDDRQSFESLVTWMEHNKIHGRKDCAEMIVGTKNDLEDVRKVTVTEAAKFARSRGFSFMEVSAKEDAGVDAAFRIIACDIFSRVHEGLIDPERVRADAGQVRVAPASIAEEKHRRGVHVVSNLRFHGPSQTERKPQSRWQ